MSWFFWDLKQMAFTQIRQTFLPLVFGFVELPDDLIHDQLLVIDGEDVVDVGFG